jgi:ElaB/YqjD/DUF883 family membrane-anchored ribosome-binding protein
MRILSRASQAIGKPDVNGLAQEFNSFVSDVERVVKDLQHLTGNSLSAARSELEGRVSRARDSLSDAGRGALDTATRTRDAMEGYVTERPWPALAIAVAVGAIVAVIFTRRSGDDR